MKDENPDKDQVPHEVVISTRPQAVIIDNIAIKQNECIANSILIARANPDVIIIEGILITIFIGRTAHACAHVWNKVGEIHFDVTKELIWAGQENMDEISSRQYLITYSYDRTEFQCNGENTKRFNSAACSSTAWEVSNRTTNRARRIRIRISSARHH